MDSAQSSARSIFQSTPSVWRATRALQLLRRAGSISIHALRVEGDLYSIAKVTEQGSISIHALRVEGDGKTPVKGADYWTISIHALRVEGDM